MRFHAARSHGEKARPGQEGHVAARRAGAGVDHPAGPGKFDRLRELCCLAGAVAAQAYPPQFAAQGEGGVRDSLVTGVSDDAGGQLAAALPARSFLIGQVFGGGPQEPGGAGYFALGALGAVVRP
jgi:hypothetical protein